MVIDVLFLLLLVVAVIRGFFKGLIVAVFTWVAYVIGLAAAMKCSHVVAEKLQHVVHISPRWMPLLTFLLIFIGVILLIRWLAFLLEKAVEGLLFGWLNKLGGIVFYVLLYVMIYSVLLFYLVQMHLLSDETLQQSVTYPFIRPIGPWIIGAIGFVVPWFKDVFAQLGRFFEGTATRIHET